MPNIFCFWVWEHYISAVSHRSKFTINIRSASPALFGVRFSALYGLLQHKPIIFVIFPANPVCDTGYIALIQRSCNGILGQCFQALRCPCLIFGGVVIAFSFLKVNDVFLSKVRCFILRKITFVAIILILCSTPGWSLRCLFIVKVSTVLTLLGYRSIQGFVGEILPRGSLWRYNTVYFMLLNLWMKRNWIPEDNVAI